MPKTILVIDTAFETCQVGIWQDEKCVTMAAVNGGGKHDIILGPLVEEILKVHHIAVKDIEKIIVTTGPGRFTGLRVGIAFARGLALVHQTPMVGVLTTDALHWQLAKEFLDKERAVIVAVKRGESFIQRAGQPIERIMDPDLADCFKADKNLLLAGILSPEAQKILENSNISIVKSITEPSLEAIYAVAKDKPPQETGLIRPFYAISC
jgi:tRNA threonylcarbamoyladenosine biosynthesis protein TsaB